MGAMVEGARCWADEAEKPRFSSTANHVYAGLVCKIPGYTAHLKRIVARSRPFRCVHTRERVRIDKKSTGGPPPHRGQPAHQRSSARVSKCSSSERF